MPTSASERQAANASRNSTVPVSGPPGPSASAPPRRTPPALVQDPEAEAAFSWAELWTPAALRGWAGSIALHGLLLLTLALWYFAPPLRRPIHFDSRLAGSPMGVPEGLTLTGGMNTPLAMPDVPDNLLPAADEPLMELIAPSLEPAAVTLVRGGKPSAGGGVANNNPGAGEGDGFGLARFGEGGEVIRGIAVKVGDPQFTLLWDSDADLDLHVIEPGGKEIYWEEPKGKQGGELDVDNTKGFGPENIYWLVESDGTGSAKVKGPGPSGVYQWFVVYWGGFGGIPKPTHWKVRIKHAGKITVINGKFRALNERSKTFTLKVDPARGPDGGAAALPPESR
jgi:hypothetical protein